MVNPRYANAVISLLEPITMISVHKEGTRRKDLPKKFTFSEKVTSPAPGVAIQGANFVPVKWM